MVSAVGGPSESGASVATMSIVVSGRQVDCLSWREVEQAVGAVSGEPPLRGGWGGLGVFAGPRGRAASYWVG